MRRAALALTLTLAACGSPSTGTTTGTGPTNPSDTPSAGPDAWAHGTGIVCVRTVDTEPVATSGSSDVVAGCQSWPKTSLGVDFAQSHAMCGPCGFALDAAASAAERTTRPDACCYRASSPPEPPPPPPPPAPPS